MARACVVLGFTMALVSVALASTHYQLCGFNSWYGGVPWSMITPTYYASEYPNTVFDFKILNSGDSLRGLVQTYLADGGSCDILTLAGASSYCLALSPVMSDTVAWVDGSATSTDLSDKLNNPYFSRVIPTDAVGAGSAAVFAISQGWRQVNVLCSDDSYGRSVADGFSRRLQKLGGQIEFSRCVSPNFAIEDLRNAANEILFGAQSRVIFFAGAFGTPGVEGLRESLAASDAIVIFTESMCSSDYLSMFPGAFCASYGIDATNAALVQNAYVTRDTATEIALYGPMLDYAAGDTSYEIDFWAAMVVDATRAALKAVYGYPMANKTKYPTMAEFQRSITFEGLTGYVSFDAQGDREDAILVVYNSHPAADNASVIELTSFATVANGSVELHSDAGASRYYVVDGSGRWLSSPPSALKPLKAAKTEFPYWVIAIIVVGVALIVVLMIAARASKSTERDSRDAPVDGTVPFTVMFTDIQASTTQWALNPEVMGPAVDQHHDLIRHVLKDHRGYEVKTIGDAFMVAFKDPADAVRAAIHIQQVLFAGSWPESIDDVYRKSSETTPLEMNTYKELWSGIRVRIGIHTGLGSIKLDPVSRGYDYYGTVVNTAARVEGVGHGGQILMTRDTYDIVHKSTRSVLEDQVKVSSLGHQPLRGLSGPTELFQILPAEFAARDFPPLRLDIEIEVEANDDEEGNTGKGDTTSNQSSVSTLARDTPEAICKTAARRANVAARDLHNYFLVVKALYSTFPAKDRTKVIADLAKRWRVPLQAVDRESECALARLVVKAAPVAATFRNPYSAGDLDVNPVQRFNSRVGSRRISRTPSFNGDRTPVDRTPSFGAPIAERVSSFGAGPELELRDTSPAPS